jgi:predicted anti-sigma-YlaC factor YlaD
MTVTDNVVKDLLTLDLAGEAHPDTSALVREWLQTHPDMARQVEQARGAGLPEVAAPPPTAEKRALDRVRRRWRARSIVLGAAIYFSTMPLTVTFNSSGFQGLLIDNWPQRIAMLVIGAALWGLYIAMPRRWHSGA